MPETYSSSTGYDPGGAVRQVTAGPGAAMLPPPGVGIPPELLALLQQREAQRAALQNRALNLQEWQAHQAAPARQAAAGPVFAAGPVYGEGESVRAERPSMVMRAAPGVAERGQPVFTKTVGGPGMTPGTIRLNQWEPGASFAGYERDLGSGPAAAGFSSAATNAQAVSKGLAADDWEQFVRGRGAAYGGRNTA